VDGLVVDVGADGCRDVVSVTLGFSDLAEMLLFIPNQVLCAGDDPGTLDPLNGGSDEGSGQVWIWTEPFLQPVSHRTRGI
jgi:hypothetical protein